MPIHSKIQNVKLADQMKRPPRLLHLGLIFLSAITSWILATSIDLDKYELGAMFNLFFPPMLGLATLIFFSIVCLVSTHRPTRLIVLTICCMLNLYLGLAFRYELPYFPF